MHPDKNIPGLLCYRGEECQEENGLLPTMRPLVGFSIRLSRLFFIKKFVGSRILLFGIVCAFRNAAYLRSVTKSTGPLLFYSNINR